MYFDDNEEIEVDVENLADKAKVCMKSHSMIKLRNFLFSDSAVFKHCDRAKRM